MGKLDAVAHDRAQALVVGQRAHEGAVELDLVARHGVQVAQRGVAGAEVVDQDADSAGTQGVEVIDRRSVRMGEHALGDFEADAVARDRAAVDDGKEFGRQVGTGELARGEVDADAQRGIDRQLARPCLNIRASLFQHDRPDVVDEVERLGERDEFSRREQAERRVRPAYQGLEPGRAQAGELDDRLVPHPQPALRERLAQLGLHLQGAQRGGVHLGLEEFDRAALAAAGLVQGVVGVA